jgi:colicin import membrane protein
MFGIGGIELMIILVVVFLIFGPDEMPKIARTIGKAMKMFNEARQDVEDVIKTEILNTEDAQMFTDPLGLKGMSKDLESTFQQMTDPDYKPVPKGAGMRVSTDDITQSKNISALDSVKTEAETEAIVGVSASDGAPVLLGDDVDTQTASSSATADPADDSGTTESVPITEKPAVPQVDRDDVASIWGIPVAGAAKEVAPDMADEVVRVDVDSSGIEAKTAEVEVSDAC